jgi:hypothetical protein
MHKTSNWSEKVPGLLGGGGRGDNSEKGRIRAIWRGREEGKRQILRAEGEKIKGRGQEKKVSMGWKEW